MLAVSKQAFLEGKAENFKNFIGAYKPSEQVQNFIATFNKDDMIMTIGTKIVPLVAAQLQESAATDLMKELTVPAEEAEKVKSKIVAYLNMFSSVLLDR